MANQALENSVIKELKMVHRLGKDDGRFSYRNHDRPTGIVPLNFAHFVNLMLKHSFLQTIVYFLVKRSKS